jgi:hypothetical protein
MPSKVNTYNRIQNISISSLAQGSLNKTRSINSSAFVKLSWKIILLLMLWTITTPTSQTERSRLMTCKPLSTESSQMDKLVSQSISMMTFHSNSKICCLEISWQIFSMQRSSKMINKSEMRHHSSSPIFSQVGPVS